MLAVDHVIVAVGDLDDAGRRFEQDHGLASVAGGRHAGLGTGNRIIPLGESYIELMAVADATEARTNPLGEWLADRMATVGEGPAALCLRSDDIVAVGRRTGRQPLPMSRTRPDGVELAWHLVALDAALADGLPFFIQWHTDDANHPGQTRMEHPSEATGIEWIELGGDPQQLATWLGPHDLPLRCVTGAPGPQRVAVARPNGDPLVIS